MKTEYLVHETLCNQGGGILLVERKKMSIFGDSINHNQDYGLPARFRELVDDIHRNIYQILVGMGKGSSNPERSVVSP